jgi:EF hand
MRLALICLVAFVLLESTAFAAVTAEADYRASDANQDGLLQMAEYKAFIKRRAQNGDASAKWVVRFGAWNRALRTVDSNKDGVISGDELRAYDASR